MTMQRLSHDGFARIEVEHPPLSYRSNHFDSLFGKITVPSGRVIALIRLFPSESNHEMLASPSAFVPAPIRTLPLRS
jgi:hypothetical protein